MSPKRRQPEGQPDRGEAEKLLSMFSVEVTGLRPGETMTGMTNVTKDALINYRASANASQNSAIVPPRTKELDLLRHESDLWSMFIEKLGRIEFFEGMSSMEREQWLEDFESPKDIDISEMDGEVEVIQLGKSDLINKLDSFQVEDVMESGWMKAEDLRKMFPGKPGSNARRHTLFFLRAFWTVSVVEVTTSKSNVPTFDINTGDIFPHGTTSDSKHIIQLFNDEHDRPFGVRINRRGMKLAIPNLIEVGKSILQRHGLGATFDEDFALVQEATKGFTAAVFKSLFQKLIRFRPKTVLVPTKVCPHRDEETVETVNAEIVLISCMILLFANPGSFVPDIQRFVTGAESATKRLIVIIYEDSYFDISAETTSLFQVVTGAFLFQRTKSFNPSEEFVGLCFDLAIRAIRENKYINYPEPMISEMEKFEIGTIKPENNIRAKLEYISGFMDEIRSFQGDLKMMRWCAHHQDSSDYPRGWGKSPKIAERPLYMPLSHCLDQHCSPEVAYLYPPELSKRIAATRPANLLSKPFAPMFEKIFVEVSGFNPRRHSPGKVYDELLKPTRGSFTYYTRKAQEAVYYAKLSSDTFEASTSNKFYDYTYELDRSWIAGMIGPIYVKGRPPALVTLHPRDPEVLVAVRKPSRDIKNDSDAILSDEREHEAINTAREMLRQGYPMQDAPPPIPELANKELVMDDSDGDIVYYIYDPKTKTKVAWENLRAVTKRIATFKSKSREIGSILCHRPTAKGVAENIEEELRSLVARYNRVDVQRAIVYLKGFSSSFELNRIGRDGGGTKYAVVIEDVGAYQFLLELTDRIPGALSRVAKSSLGFKVVNGPLMWHLRDELEKIALPQIDAGDAMLTSKMWGDIGEKKGRKLLTHQVDSLAEMEQRHTQGKSNHFLWLTVGSGKCLDPNTPVLMWNGGTKKAKHIVPGDQLVGDDNTLRNVLTTCHGRDPMYRVIQGTGDDYIVNEPHILSLKFSGHKTYHKVKIAKSPQVRVEWRDTESGEYCKQTYTVEELAQENILSPSGGVYWHWDDARDETYWKLVWFDRDAIKKCTKLFLSEDELLQYRESIPNDDVIDISVADYIKLPKSTRSRLRGYKVGVDWPSQSVDLDPYVAGLWLSGGSNNYNRVYVTNIEDEMFKYLSDWCVENGYGLISSDQDETAYGITDGFHTKLRELGIFERNTIPRQYLANDRETRLKMLAGFIDSSGWYSNGQYEIIQTQKKLAKDIAYLARSLGFAVQFVDAKKRAESIGDLYYKCIISGGLENIPCLLAENQGRNCEGVPEKAETALLTKIVVEPIGQGDYCGFTLDGNSRFLLGDFTVTHNTLIVLSYLQYLLKRGELPEYVVYTLPGSAIGSIIQEGEAMGFKMSILDPRKSIPKGASHRSYRVSGCNPRKYHISLIEHDHLRRCEDVLPSLASECMFIIDEVHKALNETKRTSVALEISRLSHEVIALTGTPIIDTHTYKLIWWLRQITEFEVNEKNFWVAANGMIAKKYNPDVTVNSIDVRAEMTADETKQYSKLVPPAMGGKNASAGPKQFTQAMNLCYDIVTGKMVDETLRLLKKYYPRPSGVFVVAYTNSHAEKIQQLLIEAGVKKKDIFVISGDKSIHLADDNVEEGKIHDYRVVISTIRRSEGYTLTRLKSMVTSVYPSNNATREQIKGRIVRPGQSAKEVDFVTVHTGVLTYIMQRHIDARNLAAVLKRLADDIS